MDYVPTGFPFVASGKGQTLSEAVLERHPLIRPETNEQAVAQFTEWALGVIGQVEAGVAEMHRRGVTFGDLHPDNALIRPDGRVTLNPWTGASGYPPPDGRTGPALDRYALGCLRLSVFLPLPTLFSLDPNKAELFAAAVAKRFPVPADYGERALREINFTPVQVGYATDLISTLDTARPNWIALQDSLVTAILTSATPERTDRLFPGEDQQFSTNGLGLAHGAAGVLYALSVAGYGRHREYEEWLLRAVRAGGAGRAVGFYDGLHGIAFALDELGRIDEAAEVLDRALAVPLADLPPDLFGGLAGVGLNLLHFSWQNGNNTLFDIAIEVADLIAARPASKAGLMHGTAGQALFFIRLFERTADSRHLALARQALEHDLGEGTYMATGGAGIGLVIQDYLRHEHVPEFAARLGGIRRAAELEFTVSSTLFNGRAGLIAFLSRLRDASEPNLWLNAVINRHLHRLAWHAVAYQGHVAFPGEQNMALSMDLATGNAGVLVALQCALGNGIGHVLPFIGPLPRGALQCSCGPRRSPRAAAPPRSA